MITTTTRIAEALDGTIEELVPLTEVRR